MTKSRSDGEGSLYQLHQADCPRPPKGCKCQWRGAYVTGYRDGKAIRKTVTATTRSAASTKLDEVKALHKGNDLPEGKAVTVEQWMTYWLTKVVPRKAKPKTIVAYTTVVNGYINPLLGHHRLDRLNAEHINDAWDLLLEDGNPSLDVAQRRPLSPNTVHHAHRVLARALKVALQRKKVTRNVAGSDSMDAPPRIEREVVPIPDDEVVKILAAATGTEYGARWSVALSLGLRPGEALGLRWENIDLKQGHLHVKEQLQRQTGKGLVLTSPKSASGVRSMVLPKTMLAALKAHKKMQTEARLAAGDHWEDSGFVFTLPNGKGVDGKVDGDRWHKLLDKAEVPQRRLYDARHSAATLMLAQGIELRVVMALLGHSQVSVTMKYQHAAGKLLIDASEKMEDGVWGSRT